MNATFTAVIHKEDNIFVAECPEVGSCSQGYSIEEAIDNLREATSLYLEETKYSPKQQAIITHFTEAQRAFFAL